MSAYGYQVAYSHWQDDLETGEVQADTDEQADAQIDQAIVALTYQRALEVPIIASIEKWRIPERRFRLDLASDADDLDVEEVS